MTRAPLSYPSIDVLGTTPELGWRWICWGAHAHTARLLSNQFLLANVRCQQPWEDIRSLHV
eukprot:6060972-Amphidinium_carterae.1